MHNIASPTLTGLIPSCTPGVCLGLTVITHPSGGFPIPRIDTLICERWICGAGSFGLLSDACVVVVPFTPHMSASPWPPCTGL